jgi:hypothetical protein
MSNDRAGAKGLTVALTATIAFGSVATVARSQPAPIRDLVSVYNDLDNMCRGWPGDDPHVGEVCDTREKLHKALVAMGYCYGKNNQSRAEFAWHRCTAGSVR